MKLPGLEVIVPGCLAVFAYAVVMNVLGYVATQLAFLGWVSSAFFLILAARERTPHDGAYALCCRPCSRKRAKAPRAQAGRVLECVGSVRPS